MWGAPRAQWVGSAAEVLPGTTRTGPIWPALRAGEPGGRQRGDVAIRPGRQTWDPTLGPSS